MCARPCRSQDSHMYGPWGAFDSDYGYQSAAAASSSKCIYITLSVDTHLTSQDKPGTPAHFGSPIYHLPREAVLILVLHSCESAIIIGVIE